MLGSAFVAREGPIRCSMTLLVITFVGLGPCACAGQHRSTQPTATPWTFSAPPASERQTGPYPEGTPLPTYRVLDIGKPGIPKLDARLMRWLKVIERSRLYRNYVSDLRFSMLPTGSVPLLVFSTRIGGRLVPVSELSESAHANYPVIGSGNQTFDPDPDRGLQTGPLVYPHNLPSDLTP